MSDSGDDDTPRTLVRKLIHLKPISSTPFTQHFKAVAPSSSRKIHLSSRKPSLQHFLKTPYFDDEVTPKTLIKNVVQEKKQRGSSLYAFKQQHKLSTQSDKAVGRSNEMEDSLDSVQQEMMKEISSAEDKDISNLSLESEVLKGHLAAERLVRTRKTKRIDLETFKAGLKELRAKRGK
ncbi:uncharacterized protein LOC143232135 [Tachypleus tridentatus]|uniref:uncharacterized protein LOC143232135 n=1 Tax=Tachypleus tridentatus TaxID=6853 RepID=UPI003FCEEE55